MPDMSYNTTDGQPPMSLIGGGTNVQMPQQQTPVMPSPQMPTQTITVPTALLNHPAVQQGVQMAQADMAKQAAAMPNGNISMGDERTQAMINNIQAMKNSGVFSPLGSPQNHPVLGALANAAMAFGQGITHQPFLSDFQQQQTARMQAQADMARYGQLTPEQQIMNQYRKDNLDLRNQTLQSSQEQKAITNLQNTIKGRYSPGGLQNSKVDAAIHARALIDQATDPTTGKVDVSKVQYNELAQSLSNLLSGSGQQSDARVSGLMQKTAQGDINGALSYFTGKPMNATSDDAIKQLVSMIDRQGNVAEGLRDNYIKNSGVWMSNNIPEDRKKELIQGGLDFVNSYKKYTSDPDYKASILNNLSEDSAVQQAQPGTQGIAAPTGSVGQQATQANTMPFQVGQQYNGHKILNVQQVK